MKTTKKVLITIGILVIIAGMFVLGRNGLNYTEGYTRSTIIEIAKQYMLSVSISTAIILLYFVIKYNKKGIIKVLITTIFGIVGTMLFALAVMALVKMPITRLFLSIMLFAYVTSIIAVSAHFEANT